MKKHEIRNIFFIKDQELIIVYLKESDWDFSHFGNVNLCYDARKIEMKYIGFGNHNNNPTLSLKLNDSHYNSVSEIEYEIKDHKNILFLEQ